MKMSKEGMRGYKPYRIRKCRVCGMPFVLGILDPDVHICPFHAFKSLKGNPKPRRAKAVKNPFSRMKKNLKRRKKR
jgi:rubredoxin